MLRIHVIWTNILWYMEKCDIPTKLIISITARLKTFESVLHLTGPIGGLSQTDIDILKTAVARQIIKPSVTGRCLCVLS